MSQSFPLACILTAILAVGALLACATGQGEAFATLSTVTFVAFVVTATLAVTCFIRREK